MCEIEEIELPDGTCSECKHGLKPVGTKKLICGTSCPESKKKSVDSDGKCLVCPDYTMGSLNPKSCV